MNVSRKSLLILASLLSLFSGMLRAQDNPNLQNGLVPFGSYDGGNFDTINLSNGNLTSARVSYNNAKGQKVDPATGNTVGNKDPVAHIPLKSDPPATPPPSSSAPEEE
jgi:hypothetical protein